uniref:Uncharacterized protein n=1 Tax=Arundo donax TaxID=35708 RepID=A0A0A9B7R1_ARUDO
MAWYLGPLLRGVPLLSWVGAVDVSLGSNSGSISPSTSRR